VGGCGEGVLVCSRDVVALGYVFAGQAHWHYAIAGVFDGAVFQFGPELCGYCFAAVVARHAFHACGYADVDPADGNAVCDCGDRLQAGGAGTVDCVEGGGGGEADVVEGHAACF